MKEVMRYADRFGIERVVSLEAFGGHPSGEPLAILPENNNQEYIVWHEELLKQYRGRLLGFVRIDPKFPEASLAWMKRWVRNGTAVGIKWGHGFSGAVPPDHPTLDPIMQLARETRAVVNIHSWVKVGGNPRRIGGANGENEATPERIANLASRWPDVTVICGHSGGDWELGIRAVRRCENVLVEIAGSDSHSGQVDYAMKVVGEDRVVWGAHGPSRSWSTALSTVLDADLTKAQQKKIFGRNLRRALEPIFKAKGLAIDV
jgi:predicted TIM-barrel fold metal-dependent hydrolase